MDSNLPKVFLPRKHPPAGLERLKKFCEVVILNEERRITRDEFLKSIPGFDALFITPMDRIDKEALDIAGPTLKVVCTFSSGLEHIDLEECRKRGIQVGCVPDTLTKAVAEMAVGLLLAAARRFQEGIESVHNGVWGTKWENALWLAGKQVSGSVIGIVGLGRIGMAAAKRLAVFEPARILYCGNRDKPEAKEVKAKFVSFHELLETSDFVLVTCSLNKSNRGMFDADAFKRMKNDAVFVNVARGALVDQDALYEALMNHQIGAAAIDVTTPEPLPTNHKLLTLKNLLVTPHLACATVETRNAMCNLTVDNILAGLSGQPLPSPAYV
ncbi:glyoxylate reductase/hydroxypyruvate reductase-like [Physella acuta]|uniref:glyoxylate reductase/hydroxypyruvate reductase-like n=1 Tax=Physella acuta TaxID=109671 RepID=UPI0027DB36BD|nr:glyoxylate reductase/hydroxypyruvate reductase-like [Physella acuta]